MKYLRVYIDKHLNWQPHVQHINIKIAKNAYQIEILHAFKDNETILLYNVLVYPHLIYGIIAWSCASETILNCLCIKRNKYLPNISFVHAMETGCKEN